MGANCFASRVPGPANAWSPLPFVPLRLACGNPSMLGAAFPQKKKRLPFPKGTFQNMFLQTTVFFLLCQILIHSCCCFTALSQRFLPLRAKTQGVVPKGMSVALIELVEMTATLNVVVSINSTTVIQTYWTTPRLKIDGEILAIYFNRSLIL